MTGPRPRKQVTAAISEEVFLKLHAARLYARKPLATLIAEGCTVVAEHYRLQRLAERTTGAPAVRDFPMLAAEGTARRKVTGLLNDELYLSLWSAKQFSRKPLKVLVAAACAHIAEHYWALRRGERAAHLERSV